MKKIHLTLILALSLFVRPVEAATVNVNIITHDMGEVPADQSGSIDNGTRYSGNEFAYDLVKGSIASSTAISFFYKPIADTAYLGYQSPVLSATTSSNVTITPSFDRILGYVRTLSNFSNKPVDFQSYYSISGAGPFYGSVLTSYETKALSPVPLPAALPLFGLGLAGLAGFKRLRKNKASV